MDQTNEVLTKESGWAISLFYFYLSPMFKKENELKKTDELVNYYRNKSDDWLLKFHNLLTPHARKEVKQAYNIVLKERGLK